MIERVIYIYVKAGADTAVTARRHRGWLVLVCWRCAPVCTPLLPTVLDLSLSLRLGVLRSLQAGSQSQSAG